MTQQGKHLLEGHPDMGTKKPQLPEDHPDVVAGSTQHGMQRIAERGLQRVT